MSIIIYKLGPFFLSCSLLINLLQNLQGAINRLKHCQLDNDIQEMLFHLTLVLDEIQDVDSMLQLLRMISRQPVACRVNYIRKF